MVSFDLFETVKSFFYFIFFNFFPNPHSPTSNIKVAMVLMRLSILKYEGIYILYCSLSVHCTYRQMKGGAGDKVSWWFIDAGGWVSYAL